MEWIFARNCEYKTVTKLFDTGAVDLKSGKRSQNTGKTGDREKKNDGEL